MADEIYAVDFDGTLCANAYPEIGEPIPEVIEHVKRLAEEGNRIVLWTCRTDERLQEAVDWCSARGITFDAVNENLPERIASFGGDTRKLAADHYIDDKAISVEMIIAEAGAGTKQAGSKSFMKGGTMNKYYALETAGSEAEIFIFGEITSWPYLESDVSSYTLAREIQGLEAEQINVHINSYGGEVAEGLAIYNVLRDHKAKVKTVCEGFACSISSAIFMAGDERVMHEASMLMLHNAWCNAAGNAGQLRKAAEDLDVISQGAVAAYMSRVNITKEELQAILDAETWMLPEEALEKGFATSVIAAKTSEGKAAASARKIFFNRFKAALAVKAPLPVPPATPAPAPEPENKTLRFFNALMGGKEKA